MWVAILFCVIAFLCSAIGLGIPYWAVYDHYLVGEVHYGIYQICSKLVGCEFTAPTGTMIGVRALESLGTLLLLVSLILAIVKERSNPARPTLFRVAAVMTTIAGIIILIGVIIFGITKEKQIFINGKAYAENYRLHAGFILSLVAGILSFVTAIIFISDKRIEERCQDTTRPNTFEASNSQNVVVYSTGQRASDQYVRQDKPHQAYGYSTNAGMPSSSQKFTL